ncbi:MAG TPA: RNA helicase, partial [Propionibacteriaceae bacterium]|nr:RNA helicase [Propionibacteriaceae bacterium]
MGTTLTTDTLPPADERHTFADLGVIEPISEALKLIGIEHPFPIQSLSIPIAIQGTDMIGQARTGTGKTLAFGVSLLQRIVVQSDPGYADLEAPGAPQALVMCPTRELALQVTRDLEVASTIRKVRILTVYGGVGYDTQLDTLSDGVDVVVGTPGRLLDLLQRRNLNLGHVKVLVLDEADEMLDLGFLPDVEKLIARTPKTR